MRVGEVYVWHRNTEFEQIIIVVELTSHKDRCGVYLLSIGEELEHEVGKIIQIFKRDLLPEELL